MKLGIAASLAHETPEEWAKKLKGLGCESVTFPVNYTASEDVIAAYEEAAHRYGLCIAEVGIWKNALAVDAAERQAAMDYSIGQLRLADRLHARCCVNVAGAAGLRWDGAYRENFSVRMWDATVCMIQEIIDEVNPKHTWFTIEPMPWMYPSGPEEYLKLIQDVKRARFAVHMDIINMINTPERYFFPEKFLNHCFELLGEHIKSCHMKDILLGEQFTFQLRECPCGEGVFPLEHYAELIDSVDPSIPVLIEHLHSDEQYIDSLKYVRKRLGLAP